MDNHPVNTAVTAARALWISLIALAISIAALAVSVVNWQSHEVAPLVPQDTRWEQARTSLSAAEIEQNRKDMERANANAVAPSGSVHSSH